jgi:hypothetical protein
VCCSIYWILNSQFILVLFIIPHATKYRVKLFNKNWNWMRKAEISWYIDSSSFSAGVFRQCYRLVENVVKYEEISDIKTRLKSSSAKVSNTNALTFPTLSPSKPRLCTSKRVLNSPASAQVVKNHQHYWMWRLYTQWKLPHFKEITQTTTSKCTPTARASVRRSLGFSDPGHENVQPQDQGEIEVTFVCYFNFWIKITL